MKNEALLWAAKTITLRNLTEKTVAATVTWSAMNSKLIVTYYVDGAISDDEEELCELTLTELLAEFSDVIHADSCCINAHDKLSELPYLEGLVFQRNRTVD